MSKKIIIPRESLPNPENTTFHVRFRVTSEDKNRVSAWTPVFSVTSDFIYVTPDPNRPIGYLSDILATQVFS